MITRTSMKSKWRLMPCREAVTFKHQTAVGTYTSYAISDAWWRDLNDKEKQASRGVYVEHERNWFLPLELLTVDVAVGDVIVDSDSNNYTVLSLGSVGGLGVGKYNAVNLALAAGLRDSISILRPMNTIEDSGLRTPTYAAVYSSIAAKIQEVEGQREEIFGKVGFRQKFNVFVGQRVTVTTEDRVQLGSTVYQIQSYTNPDRIDELMQLGVEVLP